MKDYAASRSGSLISLVIIVTTTLSHSGICNENQVVVRQPWQNMPELVKAIAKYGEVTKVLVPKGQTLVRAIDKHCGHVDPTYLAIASATNAKYFPTEPLEQDRLLDLPACVLPPEVGMRVINGPTSLSALARQYGIDFLTVATERTDAEYLVRKYSKSDPAFAHSGESVVATLNGGDYKTRALAATASVRAAANYNVADAPLVHTGGLVIGDGGKGSYSAGKIFAKYEKELPRSTVVTLDDTEWLNFTENFYGIQNSGAITWLNNLKSLDKIPGDKPILLPGLEPINTTVRLSKTVRKEDAIIGLRAAYLVDIGNRSKETIEARHADADKDVRQLKPAFLVAPMRDYEPQCGRDDGGAWPFDAAGIIRQIGYNQGFLKIPFSSRPGILVLDTGFDFFQDQYGEFFPENNKLKISSLAPYDVAAASRLSGTAFVEGINVATRDRSASSFEKDANRWHGLGVAGVALGTREFESYRHIFELPIRLAFANIERMSNDEPLIEVTGLGVAIRHVASTDIKVINISFLVPDVIDGLSATLSQYGANLILVVAAGNDGQSVAEMNTFPAKFGGEFKNAPERATVITVGAHNKKGEITDFSSFDGKRVDLLAPGCDIPSYIGSTADTAGLGLEPHEWTGTSFAAPVVSFSAGLLGAYGLKPAEIKARLLISTDVSEVLEDVVYSRGRLNLLKALSFAFDQFVIREGDREIQILASPGRAGGREAGIENPFIKICGKEKRLRSFAKIARDSTRGAAGKWHLWMNPTPDESVDHMERKELCATEKDDQIDIEVRDFMTGRKYRVTINNLLDLIPRR